MKPLLIILILSIFAVSIIPVRSLSTDELRSEIATTFVDIQKTERSGGNVTQLATDLNFAITLLNSGNEENITRASIAISVIRASIPNLMAQINQKNNETISLHCSQPRCI